MLRSRSNAGADLKTAQTIQKMNINRLEYLCQCKNCMTVMVDENPQVDAIKKTLPPHSRNMVKDGDGFWACPVCLTDDYLSDDINVANESKAFRRLYDTQTGRYMATGYNATSDKQLCEAYKQYQSIDQDEDDIEYFESATTSDIISIIKANGFDIETSETPFEDHQDYND